MNQSSILVICDEGNIYVNTLEDAQRIANEQNLDLVEVSTNVYKIMDYKKYLYDKKKSKKRLPKQETKEVQFNVSIAKYDLQRKIKDICKWLKNHYNVRVVVRLHGRENAHPELAMGLLNTIINNENVMSLLSEKVNFKHMAIDNSITNLVVLLKPTK